MVGHTGVIPATITAVETVDECLGRSSTEVRGRRRVRDHRRPRQRRADARPRREPQTAHSLNPVPLICTARGVMAGEGTLADVAPTVLELLGIEPSPKMGGRSLLEP